MAYNSERPYNDLPFLPPKKVVETQKVLKSVANSALALGELKGALGTLPNPTLFIDTVQLREAQASSAIENIITTQDDLFKHTISDKKVIDPAVKEVLHYKDALYQGVEFLEKMGVMTTNLFIRLVQVIKQNQAGIRNEPGTALTNPATRRVVYTPPEGEELIRNLLANLESYIHNEKDEVNGLIKMAVIHYQFEAIHPFFDGNGRTGRIISLLYLMHIGYLDNPALFLSGYIERNKTEYYRKLRGVTENNNWEEWILYMLEAVEKTARKDRSTIKHISRLMEDMGNEIKDNLPQVYSKELIDELFRLPYTKRARLEEAGIGSRKTLEKYLKLLEEKKFLKSEMVGKEKLYVNVRLLELLKR